MRIAFQMDAPAGLKPATDTTLMLIQEACTRGHSCFWYHPSRLSWREGELLAPLASIAVDAEARLTLGEETTTSLAQMDCAWIRQDPPYDMGYLTATWLLERLSIPIYNHPTGIRNAPEKLSALRFAQCMPPTLISGDEEAVLAFAATHGDIVAKPLYGFGGHSVFRFKQGDGNLITFLEHLRTERSVPWMWQTFLPAVAQGERRIILVDGEVAAIFGRQPASGSIRANMRVGGSAVKAEITPAQVEICAALAPMLRENGLFFVGLDVIGDALIEINVTSPTGLRAAQGLYGVNLAATMWDKIESRIKN